MATTPSTSGAGGVLYRLDGQLRVAAFVAVSYTHLTLPTMFEV